MSRTTRPTAPRPEPHAGLGVSRYDQVSGLLVAVLIILGSVTTMMFLIWLSSRLFFLPQAVPVTVLEDVGGGGAGQLAPSERELEEPNPEELLQLLEPPIEQTIQTVASVVQVQYEELEALEGDTSIGAGDGPGVGDGRGKGPGGPGTSDGIPPWERWEIQMSAANIDEYARQLDFFRVELGVAGGGNPNVDYVSNLSAPRPTVRIGNPKDERRLRFLHRAGELRQADRRLAEKAGVRTDGRVVFQFYNEQAYQRLLALEAARKGQRPIREVRRTVFGVRGTPGGYEFYVLEQHYIGGAS